MKPLPVDSLLPDLIAHVRTSTTAIVEAPPGSGKTTRIAPGLIDAELCDSRRRTFLLQPRRVAATSTAQRIADERQWKLGRQVGYQVRFESKISAATSLIVATEGILLRRLSTDPTIEDVGTVILDEFHERSLNADLLIGMLRQIQQLVRNDLRLIVMSATLDAGPITAFLDAPVFKTTGTLHPVEIKYRSSKFNSKSPGPPTQTHKLSSHVADTIERTVEKSDGDVLVFLPGIGEISQVEKLLRKSPTLRDVRVLPLHGSLPLEQQAKVLRSTGQRRIILSTNVAETSLTIEGIRTVIDSGQVRVLRFNPAVGLDRLQLEPISQASAKQRAGRAGRLESGKCIRLWDERSHSVRPLHLEPEIRRVDLSAAVLQLYQWGERPDEFPWFQAPRTDSLAAAVQLLERLGAIHDHRITDLGNRMAQLPVSPRLARMLIESKCLGNVEPISLVAAMLSERDPFIRAGTSQGRPPAHSSRSWNCDITQRFLALKRFLETGEAQTPFGEVHRSAAYNIQKVARRFASNLTDQFDSKADPAGPVIGHCEFDSDDFDEIIPKALLAAFPDRLARRRKPGGAKGLMVGGRGVRIGHSSGVQSAELFLCIDVDDQSTEATVRQASGIDSKWLPSAQTETREEQFFNPTRRQVEARRRRYWNDLMLSEQTAPITDEIQCRDVLFHEASKNLASVLPDEKSAFHSWLTRIECLRAWAPDLELPMCDEAMQIALLAELCPNRRSFTELKAAPWLDWLKARLTPEQQQAVERQCPERVTVPSGSQVRIDYAIGKPPVLSVRIQEVFSWTETPRIAFGRVPLLLHLLAPNFRPQQVTDDLASFWANTYEVVRKELRRRYPKHAWPDDPTTARPECKGGRRNHS